MSTSPTFVATGEADDKDQLVTNTGFFPDIKVGEFRERYRLDDGTIPTQRIIETLQASIINTNHDLNTWVAEQIALGYLVLEDIPATNYIDYQERLTLYNTAIYSKAKAMLIEEYPDYDTTKSGHDRAGDLQTTVADYQARAFTAIRKLQDKPRCVIEAL